MKRWDRYFQNGICVAAISCLGYASLTLAQAADRPAHFKVAATQIQALGIQSMALTNQSANQSNSVAPSFPAQVVVPIGAEQVVSSPAAGLIAQVLVEPYQAVRLGAPLVRITSPELGQWQLQLLQTASRAILARQTSQREQQLFDEGIIAGRRVQEAQAALKEAEGALAQAKATLRLSGMSEANMERIIASGKPQDGITLLAPQAGTVTEIQVKPGQRIEAATALLHVTRTDTLWLEIQLPASEAINWPTGAKIGVPSRGITARVVSVSPVVSPSNQMRVLRAAIEDKSTSLRPGEMVTAELPVGVTQGGWDVPLSALAHDQAKAYVFVRTQEGFAARPVKVIASSGQNARVQGALKAGEQIAISGIVALKGAWLNEKGGK